MSLRSKTLLAVTITLVGLVASLSLLISTVFARGLLRIEREDLQHHVHEALDRLHAKDSLVLRADWASWDDAYRFIEDENGDFVSSNLTENVLGKLDHSLLFRHLDISGQSPVESEPEDQKHHQYQKAAGEQKSEKEAGSDTKDTVFRHCGFPPFSVPTTPVPCPSTFVSLSFFFPYFCHISCTIPG